jgi:hypothetical protein
MSMGQNSEQIYDSEKFIISLSMGFNHVWSITLLPFSLGRANSIFMFWKSPDITLLIW